MKNIVKRCSMKEAEVFQDELYSQYDHVRLIYSPLFSEVGTYVWEVK